MDEISIVPSLLERDRKTIRLRQPRGYELRLAAGLEPFRFRWESEVELHDFDLTRFFPRTGFQFSRKPYRRADDWPPSVAFRQRRRIEPFGTAASQMTGSTRWMVSGGSGAVDASRCRASDTRLNPQELAVRRKGRRRLPNSGRVGRRLVGELQSASPAPRTASLQPLTTSCFWQF